MSRHESKALETLLTTEQLLECIDEQKRRTAELGILVGLPDIAMEKGYISFEQLDDAVLKLEADSSQVDLMGIGNEPLSFEEKETPEANPATPEMQLELDSDPDAEADFEFSDMSEPRPAPPPDPAQAQARHQALLDTLEAPSGFTVAGPEAPRVSGAGAVDSGAVRNLLAELAFSGEIDSEMCCTALTELAGETLVGKQFLGYRLVFLIGEGPISDVFKAVARDGEHVYALKIMPKRTFVNPLTVRRALSRLRVASRLSHPNVLQPVEFGETDQHLLYALYDYVEAVPLWLLIRRHQRLSQKMSLAIIRFVARGLQHAHKSGVVHGNLKPANVLVTPRGVVRVADWGTPRTCVLLAEKKLVEKEARLSLISEGVTYLSPELVKGEAEVGPSCDIYSLGAMLFHLLTGRAPYSGDREHVLEAILKGFPPLPEGVAGRATADLLALMTDKNTERRCQSIDALLPEIEGVLAGLDK